MRKAVKNWLAQSREKLVTTTLSAADLNRLETLLSEPRQQVLYLYSKSTNMRSPLASWALYDPTVPQEPTLPNAEPPYESVLAAMADGWRVVQFPSPNSTTTRTRTTTTWVLNSHSKGSFRRSDGPDQTDARRR